MFAWWEIQFFCRNLSPNEANLNASLFKNPKSKFNKLLIQNKTSLISKYILIVIYIRLIFLLFFEESIDVNLVKLHSKIVLCMFQPKKNCARITFQIFYSGIPMFYSQVLISYICVFFSMYLLLTKYFWPISSWSALNNFQVVKNT